MKRKQMILILAVIIAGTTLSCSATQNDIYKKAESSAFGSSVPDRNSTSLNFKQRAKDDHERMGDIALRKGDFDRAFLKYQKVLLTFVFLKAECHIH